MVKTLKDAKIKSLISKTIKTNKNHEFMFIIEKDGDDYLISNSFLILRINEQNYPKAFLELKSRLTNLCHDLPEENQQKFGIQKRVDEKITVFDPPTISSIIPNASQLDKYSDTIVTKYIYTNGNTHCRILVNEQQNDIILLNVNYLDIVNEGNEILSVDNINPVLVINLDNKVDALLLPVNVRSFSMEDYNDIKAKFCSKENVLL